MRQEDKEFKANLSHTVSPYLEGGGMLDQWVSYPVSILKSNEGEARARKENRRKLSPCNICSLVYTAKPVTTAQM